MCVHRTCDFFTTTRAVYGLWDLPTVSCWKDSRQSPAQLTTHGTADMISAARQVQEKCRKQRRDLCFAFIDLTKALDSVNKDALWGRLARLGCPPKFVSVT